MKIENKEIMDFLGVSKMTQEQCLIILSLISDRLSQIHLQDLENKK